MAYAEVAFAMCGVLGSSSEKARPAKELWQDLKLFIRNCRLRVDNCWGTG